MTIRTRFAPSPTGFMHVGNFRTGLFAWLVARHFNGTFIIRFEDTDKKREVEGAREHILGCFEKLGIDYDEGPNKGGNYGPYIQSERLESYTKWAHKLIDSGRAYADPYTPDEVQEFRIRAQKDKKPFLYRNNRPNNPPIWDGTKPLRFKSDPKPYTWHDEVMGDLSTGPEVIDDIVLIKSDGYPTYNFAHIIDDYEMKISHVIRGQEFLASTPNYLNIYEALEIDRPLLATMPHIMASDGKKKLGKRDGAKDILDYVRDGYLPEALVSFIATLGWNDGTEQEIFTKDELINKFSLDRVQKSGAKFDEQRLKWINGSLIRNMPVTELFERSQDYWPDVSRDANDEYKKQILSLVQERLKYLSEIPGLTNFFFVDQQMDKELILSHKQLKKIPMIELKELLVLTVDSFELSNFKTEDLTDRLNALLEATEQKPAVLFSLIRIATTWAPSSPGLAETLQVLGKKTSMDRLRASIDFLAHIED